MNKKSINASNILLDISRGYSVFEIGKETLYFKHPSNQNYLQNEEYYEKRLSQAKKRGISSEERLLKEAIKHNFWSVQKDEKLKSLEWTINKSNIAAEKITDNTQKNIFLQSIKKQEDELKSLEKEKLSITRDSAESLASQQRMFKMVEDHIYKDAGLSKKYKAKDEYAISIIIEIQNKISELSGKEQLLAAAFEPSFFDIYSVQYRDPLSIFNVDFYNITIFQRYLFSYASVLLNKLRNIEIPEEIRQDPLKIYNFNPDQSDKKGSKTTHGVEDMRSAMQNNGKLSAEDLLK